MIKALDAFESARLKSLPESEKNPYAFPSDHPAVQRLAQTLSKIFHALKSEENYKRVPQWEAYRNEKKIKTNVVRYEHCRAGIICPAATHIVELKDHIRDFLEGETSNIHKCALFDLNDPMCDAETFAVAIFDVEVMSPLWRTYYGKEKEGKYHQENVHILDMSKHLTSLDTYLEEMVEDADSMLFGRSPFPAAFLEKDKVDLVLRKMPQDQTIR